MGAALTFLEDTAVTVPPAPAAQGGASDGNHARRGSGIMPWGGESMLPKRALG